MVSLAYEYAGRLMTKPTHIGTSSRGRGSGVEEIRSSDDFLMALIVRNDFTGEKYNFPTPPEFALQLGINFYSSGEVIKAHRHPPRARQFSEGQEFIVVSQGKVRLHLYNEDGVRSHSIDLMKGDAALLVRGGHGLDVLEDARITEIKLGPYEGSKDKVHL